MDIKDLQKHWDEFGKSDPLWAILAWRDRSETEQAWQLEEFFRVGEQEANALVEYVRSVYPKASWGSALDFGCGIGRVTQPLCRYFDEVYGVDIAPSMLKLAEEHNEHKQKCHYVLNEKDDLEVFPDDRFDFIYSSITLQHMEPRYAMGYLKEFLRILHPGGLLVFQLPSGPNYRKLKQLIRRVMPKFVFNAYRKTRDRLEKEQPRIEMYGTKRRKVEQLLEESGAKVLDVRRDDSAGDYWKSLKYCAVRRGSPTTGSQ